jgi:uncharacterized protein (DUF1499 family)
MNMVAMMVGRGAGGMPPAEPVDFAQLVLPASPNAHLAAPAGQTAQPHDVTPLLPVDPAIAWAALRRLGAGKARVWTLAEFPALRQMQWVERSRLMNYPDIIVAQVIPLPGGSGYFLYSRSLVGYSDFGVNRTRVTAWRADFKALLRGG